MTEKPLKHVCIILFVIVVGRIALACSADGEYTDPPTLDAGQPTEDEKDASEDVEPLLSACEAGATVEGHDASTTTCVP